MSKDLTPPTSQDYISVLPYTDGGLPKLFAQYAGSPEEKVKQKLQLTYFRECFAKLSAETIVAESVYTDHDFLEDYASYYVKCFGKYRSRCTRLHFFDIPFDEEELRNAASGSSANLTQETLNKHYLGFVIIKPLPKTFIGRTCLRTYPKENRREFPTTRIYSAHLLGFNLEVESLAYQEQDTVAAACATSALWSTFHATGMVFQHPILSPVEITQSATSNIVRHFRIFPNNGLTSIEIAQAIKNVGLEPEVIGVKETDTLKSATYAYLNAGIPFMLSGYSVDSQNPNLQEIGHAIAVTGYSLGHNNCIPSGRTGILLRSSRIDKIYSHDDQVGPFSRMAFLTTPLQVGIGAGKKLFNLVLDSSWYNGHGRFLPDHLILPLYHKIRITLSDIMDSVYSHDLGLEKARLKHPQKKRSRLEWDIYLTTEDKIKSELQQQQSLDRDELWRYLETPFPKYIWKALALHNNEPAVEFLYDATDIAQGDFLHAAIFHDMELKSMVP